MSETPRWLRSPVHNWIAALVSLGMLILYVQRLVGPDPRPSTPWVTAAWAIMLLIWLASAIYKTWIQKK
jgi:uncharacterized membrane protein